MCIAHMLTNLNPVVPFSVAGSICFPELVDTSRGGIDAFCKALVDQEGKGIVHDDVPTHCFPAASC